ncbi:MAG: serine/threonine-protein kinase [Myxococcota bacterium]
MVEAVLGHGANASVYLVHDTRKNTHHALKVLHRVDSRLRARLEQEAVLRKGLHHPNIVGASKVIDVDGEPALVLEYVEGPTLERWLIEDVRADLNERIAIFRGVVEGCKFAHQWGLIHRDLKPSNVLLKPTTSGAWIPRISDFGLVKALEPEVGRYGGLTTVNTGLGTAGYAAPEQVRDAANVDHRADLYALGCILYELVCGIGPFAGLSAFDTLQAQRDSRFVPPESIAPNLPPALYDLIRQSMSVRPADRPADCAEVLKRLESVNAALEATPSVTDLRPNSLGDLLFYTATLSSVPIAALACGGLFAWQL